MVTGELILKIEAKVDQFLNGIQAVKNNIDSVIERGNSFGNTLTATFAKGQLLATGIQEVASSLIQLGKSIIEDTSKMEEFQARLASIHGSTKTASEMLDFLRETALKTPFELPGLIEADASLAKFGQNAVKWLPIIGDLAAGTNKSIEETAEVVGRALTGDTRYLMMLQRQFGISKEALAEFGAKFTENTQGKVKDIDSLGKALEAYIKANYAGAMAKQEGTLKDAWEDFNLTLQTFRAELGKNLVPILKSFLESLIFLINAVKTFSSSMNQTVSFSQAFMLIMKGLLALMIPFREIWINIRTQIELCIATLVNFGKIAANIVTFNFKELGRTIQTARFQTQEILKDWMKDQKNLLDFSKQVFGEQTQEQKNYNALQSNLEKELFQKKKYFLEQTNELAKEKEKELAEQRRKAEQERLNQALKWAEQEAKIRNLSYNDQIYNLERIKKKYAKTAEERREIDVKIKELEERNNNARIKAKEEETKGFIKQIQQRRDFEEETLQEALKRIDREFTAKEEARKWTEEQERKRTDFYIEESEKVLENDQLSLQEKKKILEEALEYEDMTAEARQDILKKISEIQEEIEERQRENIEAFTKRASLVIANLASVAGQTYQNVIEQGQKMFEEENMRYEETKALLESELQDREISAEKRAEILQKLSSLEAEHTNKMIEYEGLRSKALKEAWKSALVALLDSIMVEVRGYAVKGIAWAVTNALATGGASLLAIPAIAGAVATAEAGVIALKSKIAALQYGTPRVPRTGIYLLHEGERVIPKRRVEEIEGRNINISLNFNIDKIEKEADERRLASLISNQIALRLENLGRA